MSRTERFIVETLDSGREYSGLRLRELVNKRRWWPFKISEERFYWIMSGLVDYGTVSIKMESTPTGTLTWYRRRKHA